MEPPSLDELALKNGTDKASTYHAYTQFYEEAFAPLRFMCPMRILEIGIAGGASLKMWRDYFFEGYVWGIDHNPASIKMYGDRITALLADANDGPSLSKLGGAIKPNIVIDDASHYAAPQQIAFEALWPHVEPGGFYAIEDLHTAYRPGYGDITPFLFGLVHDLNMRGSVEYAGQEKGNLHKIASLSFSQSLVIVRKALS